MGEAFDEVSDTSDHVDDEHYNIEYEDLDGIGLRMRGNNGSEDESPIGTQPFGPQLVAKSGGV